MSSLTGAQLIARTLKDLDVKVLFGIVGIPVVEIAEEVLNLGIRFVAFRNEQAASYAATAYGYLTGRPGVCLVVGGPGVLHAIAGIGNATANAFPLLLLAGSSESHLTSKGAFQELDAISLLTPQTKQALRPVSLDLIPSAISNAYRTSFYGRPGASFVDLPADLIQGSAGGQEIITSARKVILPPKGGAQKERVLRAARLLQGAKAPLVIVGKGSAYAKAEGMIRELIESTSIPFLPTPMGKGVLPDSHPQNTASARSMALKSADVVLVLGARLNWILHFGDAPKWNPKAKFIQVDICAEEIGRNQGDPELGIVGDITVVVEQLLDALHGWRYDLSSSDFAQRLEVNKKTNLAAAVQKAKIDKMPMTYNRAFNTIKLILDKLSPPEEGGIVYVSEGANTMDISRSIFTVEHPRLRLDAGTYATMGVGMGYAIAAHVAYNSRPESEGHAGSARRKKIVAFEGDSAFGFSAMEVETMARYQMDILIFVINNGGVYHGDSATGDEWLKLQQASVDGGTGNKKGLRSTSLGWEVGYEKIADACGGKGYLVRTPEELAKAAEDGFNASVPVVVNVIIEAGQATKLEFGWQASTRKPAKAQSAKL